MFLRNCSYLIKIIICFHKVIWFLSNINDIYTIIWFQIIIIEKIDKYVDLARELKKLWNVRLTVLPVVVDTLGTAPKKSPKELEIKERINTIQTSALLRLARKVRRVLET